MIDIKDKSILLFSPSFFGYDESITQTLLSLGAQVDCFDERPDNTFFSKALIRLNSNLLFYHIEYYYNRIYDIIKNKTYDYVFVVNIEAMPDFFLKKIKNIYSNAQFILYMWDSIFNKQNTVNYLHFFDKVFSFDKIDCERLKVNFLPLFYLDDYSQINSIQQKYDYDLLFVGTVHSDRYQLIKNIEYNIEQQGGKSFIYFFFPSKILYYKMKLQNNFLRATSVKDFYFKSLSKESLVNLYASSRIIIDIQHPKQTGLTIRCIETVGAKRKLITTNQYIKEYDFYSEQNILVIDRSNPVIPQDFLNLPYSEISDDIYKKYSIQNWINIIFR